jgi:large repetitive protein
MATSRFSHTATLLANGKVLVAGGYADGGNNPTNSAELFDSATGLYTATGSMLDVHAGHTATLLANGKVLVVDHGTNNTSAELYDPIAGVWSPAGPTPLLFESHAAALLKDGRVLVMGGVGGFGTASNCYIFNPSNSTWTVTGSMQYPTAVPTATLLTNGNVLAAGGFLASSNTPPLSSASLTEVYDVTSGTWTVTSQMNAAHSGHTANLLPNGKVLVAGPDGSAELFDPASATWTKTGSMSAARQYAFSSLLLNGQVLVIGGQTSTGGSFVTYPINTNSADIFDPTIGSWHAAASLSYSPSSATATLLPNGKVLVNGGHTNVTFTGGVANLSAVYDPGLGFAATNQPQLTSVPSNVYSNAAVTLGGSGFRGVSEAASGTTANSASDHPIVQLRAVESTRVARLVGTLWSSNACTVVGPTNFPQGPAMLTLFVNGIYSSSALVNFSTAPMGVSFFLVNPIKLGDGSFRFNFTNAPGVSFTTFASTNVALPSSNWANLGVPTESSAGSYQFTDSTAATNRMRFYRVQGN